MRKISSAELARVMNDGAVALVSVTQERDEALRKLAALECRMAAEKLASSMHEKGVELDVSHEELTTRLEKAAHDGSFQNIKDAVEMLTPNMGIKTASLTRDGERAQGTHPFVNHLLGGL